MVGLGDFVKRKGHVTNHPAEHRCRPPDVNTVLQDERSALLPTAPTKGEGGNHRKGTPTPWRSAVVRSPQQLAQYQVVTARVLAQCREFAVLEPVIQIGEFVLNRARPVELIAELLQRHPLHRLLHDTTVIASPRIHRPSVAEPNQIRLRIGKRKRPRCYQPCCEAWGQLARVLPVRFRRPAEFTCVVRASG